VGLVHEEEGAGWVEVGFLEKMCRAEGARR